jgi:hypothetical protein
MLEHGPALVDSCSAAGGTTCCLSEQSQDTVSMETPDLSVSQTELQPRYLRSSTMCGIASVACFLCFLDCFLDLLVDVGNILQGQ